MATGLYFSLFASPEDYRQGDVVRIMYLHVPCAWISLGAYTVIAALGLATLVKKDSAMPVIARAIAPVGACFTSVCLVAGSVWGKYTWGTWWVWDARLTSVLLLLFLFLGYTSLWNVFEDQHRAARTTALFAVFSAINVPIVKFSVDIWSTLHQTSSILRKGGIAIDPAMLVPLITMFVALSLLFVVLAILRVDTLLNKRETQALMQKFCSELQ
ncbi:heme ABC transporter permease CcmC [Candidatus Anaplasma sp. TIGMIC]|nr:heme ABC transporter permease CcmC [Candidatus Anaplasma sp. TIGMIC]MDB1135146.1 heme ABC transporter permease CcmC [Candidatus Anaplasma sp. TIGMIC]